MKRKIILALLSIVAIVGMLMGGFGCATTPTVTATPPTVTVTATPTAVLTGMPQAVPRASHIGLVVQDTEAAKAMLGELFGIGPWWTGEADITSSEFAIGNEPFQPFKLMVSHARLFPDTTIELLEPIGPSLWADFLAQTGGGIHHIAFDVTNWQEMVDATKAAGGEMLIAANVFGAKFCYMRLPDGLIVEWADQHIHADAEFYLRSKDLPTLEPSHIGTVVENTDQSKALLAKYEIGPWWTGVADVGPEYALPGEPFAPLKLNVSHAVLLQRTTLELLEPLGPGLWADFLEQTGGGVHHIAWDVPNWQEMVDATKAAGGEMLVAAEVFGKKFCYMKLPIGLVIEWADLHIHADAEKLLGITE